MLTPLILSESVCGRSWEITIGVYLSLDTELSDSTIFPVAHWRIVMCGGGKIQGRGPVADRTKHLGMSIDARAREALVWEDKTAFWGPLPKSKAHGGHGGRSAAWPMYWFVLGLHCAVHCEDAR